jgi:hypothetical protein
VAPAGYPATRAALTASHAVDDASAQVRARHAIGASHWFTHRMDAPLPGPGPEIDPNEPVPDDAAELLPDAPEPLPPAPIESTPDDPGGDPGGVPEPA